MIYFSLCFNPNKIKEAGRMYCTIKLYIPLLTSRMVVNDDGSITTITNVENFNLHAISNANYCGYTLDSVRIDVDKSLGVQPIGLEHNKIHMSLLQY